VPQPTERLFDRRVVERFIRRGLTTRQDYEKYLGELPDAADNVATVDLDESGEDAAADDGAPGTG